MRNFISHYAVVIELKNFYRNMVKLKLSKLVLLTGLTYFLSSYSIAASERGSLRNILKSTPLAISTNMIYDAALVPNLGDRKSVV